jgi:general secretion pathway protein D
VQLVRSLAEKLDRAPADGGNGAAGNIYVVYLKNADAVRLAMTLRAALAAEPHGVPGMPGAPQAGGAPIQPLQPTGTAQANASGQSPQATAPLNNANPPSVGGQIQADPATTSLIITAPEPHDRQIRAVIDRLDGRRAQVLVESLIVEVNADKAAEFGVQWQSGIGNSGSSNVGVIGTNSNVGGQNIIGLALGMASGGTLGTTKIQPGMNFGIGRRYGNDYVLGFLARFFQSNGEGNVLSTPNLLTLDNEEAKIVIGQNLPFVTGQFTNTGAANGSVNPFQTIERKDVGLTLRVRPTINENGTVKLQVFQEVSSVDPASAISLNGPITNKRSIESSVLVEDGNIVVLGGLLQDEYSKTNDKVPLLGDVPILGNLFRSEVRSRKKTNLMVFLRPVVVRDAAASNQLALDRYDALRVLQQNAQPEPSMAMRNVSESAILPPLPPLPQTDRRIEGTRLVPPPITLSDTVPVRQAPQPGMLPPTADPMTQREYLP